MPSRYRHQMWLAVALVLAVCLYGTTARGASTGVQNNAETMRLGEQIYRKGLLPDGTPLRGYVRGDVEIDSTMFSCENCHARSGLGSVEGQIVSPPVNGPTLFNPRYLFKDDLKNVISKRKGVTREAKALRPAYTDETLADAIRGGTNPDGREFLPVMPRYEMGDKDMAILVNYLKHLSSTFSPGVDDKSIRFATIVTDDVSADDRKAMLASLETLVTINQQTKNQRKDPRFFKMFRMLDAAFYKEISIKTWELKGDPSTWRGQLEAYYKSEPVFAILGGISNRPWQPIHEFCEENKIPCLFPVTDLPVVSTSSWYTCYASKGFYQEGETAARYLADRLADKPGGRILQLVRASAEGEALSTGFTVALQERGLAVAETVKLQPGQRLDEQQLRTLLKAGYAAAVIWDGSEAVSLLKGVSREAVLPLIMLSSRYLGQTIADIPEGLRENVYLTYPYRLPEDEKNFANYAETFSLGKLKQPDNKRIASRTFSMIHLFLLSLKEMKLNYYRDTMLDAVSMLADQYLPDYVRYSFGPGQRYASKGCYIMQLGAGDDPKFITRSDWVVF